MTLLFLLIPYTLSISHVVLEIGAPYGDSIVFSVPSFFPKLKKKTKILFASDAEH